MYSPIRRPSSACPVNRAGAATLDYVLVLGALFPIAGVAIYLGSRIIWLAYHMTSVLVGWPFM
jgi:hypothetical protein